MQEDFFTNFEKKHNILTHLFCIKHKLNIEKLEKHLENFKVLYGDLTPRKI